MYLYSIRNDIHIVREEENIQTSRGPPQYLIQVGENNRQEMDCKMNNHYLYLLEDLNFWRGKILWTEQRKQWPLYQFLSYALIRGIVVPSIVIYSNITSSCMIDGHLELLPWLSAEPSSYTYLQLCLLYYDSGTKGWGSANTICLPGPVFSFYCTLSSDLSLSCFPVSEWSTAYIFHSESCLKCPK